MISLIIFEFILKRINTQPWFKGGVTIFICCTFLRGSTQVLCSLRPSSRESSLLAAVGADPGKQRRFLGGITASSATGWMFSFLLFEIFARDRLALLAWLVREISWAFMGAPALEEMSEWLWAITDTLIYLEVNSHAGDEYQDFHNFLASILSIYVANYWYS